MTLSIKASTPSNPTALTRANVVVTNQRVRYIGLDVLRFIAVFLVLGAHISLPDGDSSPLMAMWHRGGWVGVELFFVLSGFLVSGLLFDEFQHTGRVDIGRFLIRRAWKIYPSFWLFIAFTVAWRSAFQFPAIDTARETMAELLFVQNYFPGLWGHTWTLAAEEHFYLSLAFGFLLTVSDSKSFAAPGAKCQRAIPYLFGVCLLISVLLRMTAFQSTQNAGLAEPRWFQLAGTHLHFDSFLWGFMLAYYWRYGTVRAHIERIPTLLLLIAGSLLLSPAFIDLPRSPFVNAIMYCAYDLGSTLMVIWSLRLMPPHNPAIRAIAVMGMASYSIYLWHGFMGSLVPRMLSRIHGTPADPKVVVFLYVIFSLAAGLALTRLVEWPTLALRERWFPRRATELLSYPASKSTKR